MGRELKRVSQDFNWPLDEPWEGYINQHYKGCEDCNGSGSTSARDRLSDLVSLIMISGSDAHREICHPNLKQAPLYHTQGAVPSKEMVELTTGLAGRHPSIGIGHDSMDGWSAVKKIIEAAGLPVDWGYCKTCNGDGMDPKHKEAYDNWQSTEPPEGDGYQIWETVSEGSPISPVFATPEELANFMSNAPWGADKGSSYETWLKFINVPGWAPSLIIDENGIHNGFKV